MESQNPQKKGYHRPSSSTTRTVSLNTNKLNLTMKFTLLLPHITTFIVALHYLAEGMGFFSPLLNQYRSLSATTGWNAVPKFRLFCSFLPRVWPSVA